MTNPRRLTDADLRKVRELLVEIRREVAIQQSRLLDLDRLLRQKESPCAKAAAFDLLCQQNDENAFTFASERDAHRFANVLSVGDGGDDEQPS